MPTSGEAKIHAASTYNLRSKPLPRTRQAANKENATTSRIPTRKSKLPVKSTTSNARKPPLSNGGSTKTRSQTRVRTVPNFEKLHKNWQKKFHQGKAVDKKPCTQTEEFDFTRQGSRFKRSYFSGDEQTDEEDVFEEDQAALDSIMNNRGLGNDVITGRTTVATMGVSRQTTRAPDHRQTLGALPNRYNSRANNALNMPSAAKIPRGNGGVPFGSSVKSRQWKRSLVDEQEDFVTDLEFQEDNNALDTILTDTGIQRHHSALTRQTIAGAAEARTYQRTSIYYQKPKNDNRDKVYADFARLTIGGVVSPTLVKLRGLDSSQMLPRNFTGSSQATQPVPHPRVATLNNTPAGRNVMHHKTPEHSVMRRTKTPGTASRVPSRHQDMSCSPALRTTRPPHSALRMANSQSKGPRTVCWAEVLNSPPDSGDSMTNKDELATALFVDEDSQFSVPHSVALKQQQELHKMEADSQFSVPHSVALKQQQELHKMEADTVANRHKMEEMEAIELQLQREIEKLRQEDAAVSVPTNVPYTAPAPQQNPVFVGSQPQYVEHQLHARPMETEIMPSGLIQQSLPSAMTPSVVSRSHVYGQPASMGPMQINSGVRSTGFVQPSAMTPTVVSRSQVYEQAHSIGQPASMKPMQINSGVMSTGFVQQSLLTTPAVSHQQQIMSQQQNSVQTGIMPVNSSHHLINEELHKSVQSHYQLQPDNGYQRSDVVSSQTHQRPVIQDTGRTGFHSTQQPTVHNSAQLGVRQVLGNQRVETVVVERAPMVPNGASQLATNLSQVGSAHGNANQMNLPSHHNSFIQHQAMGRALGERSTAPSESLQVTRPLQPQPSVPSVIPAHSLNMPQTNNLPIGSMSTMYGLPLDPTKKSFSGFVTSIPSRMPGTGATPLQPKTYATKPTLVDSVIQTPHPVKPENHYKHQVMKQYTPAVQNKSQHHALVDIPVPIQTPMAMRNVMLQGQRSGYRGCLVSPVAQMPTPAALQPGNIDQRPSSHFTAVAAPMEPKLKLDFENVDDIASVELSPIISILNGPAVVPNIEASVNISTGAPMSSNLGVDHQPPVMRLKGQWNKNMAGQLFHETLLDEECALYTCRIQGKFSPKPQIERNFCNPIAKVLMEGDDMHFVPLACEFIQTSTPAAGSAFNSYATWT